MKTKKPTQARSQTSKLIASHALVAAFFTNPWIVFAYSDLFAILNGPKGSVTRDNFFNNLQTSMSTLSFVLLMVAIVALAYYLLKKSK